MTAEATFLGYALKFVREFAWQLVLIVVSIPVVAALVFGASILPERMQEAVPFVALTGFACLAFFMVRGFWRLIKEDING